MTRRAVRVSLLSVVVVLALMAGSMITSAPPASASGAGVTVAGGNGTGPAADQFQDPFGVARDTAGNIYVADSLNHRVQLWAPGAVTGVTVAGGNGQGAAANQLNNPRGVAVDSFGAVYVADTFNNRVQRWVPGATTGVMVAGGFGGDPAGPVQQLNAPFDVAVDAAGNVYVLDFGNNRVTRWAPGAITGVTVAGGNGAGSAANQLDRASGLALDSFNNVYIADALNHRVQRWAPGAATGVTVAGGNGMGSGANQLDTPFGVAVDGAGNIFVADTINNRIQRWVPGGTAGQTVAGGNGLGAGAVAFSAPLRVVLDSAGNLYVSDWGNDRVQRWAPWPASGVGDGVTVAGGNGQGAAANQLNSPFLGAVDSAGAVYVADSANHRVQRWAPGATSGVTVAGGNGQGGAASQLSFPVGVAIDGAGNIYVADYDNDRVQLWAPGASAGVTVAGGNGRGAGANQFNGAHDVVLDAAGNIYVTDYENDRVQRWAPNATTGVTVAGGNGVGSGANQFIGPSGLAIDGAGNIYIADFFNDRVQRWAPNATSGVTVAGSNGQGGAANQLNRPQDVAIDALGNLYVADYFNDRVQRWAPGATSGVTIAGGNGRGAAANQLDRPTGVGLGGGNLYVSDSQNGRVQVWSVGVPGPDPVDLVSVVPARVLETRVGAGLVTVDGLFQGGGRLAGGSTLELTVAGRGGVPVDAAAVMVNVTGVGPDGPGFVTVFPCGTPPPNASNLNFVAGDVVPNAVLAKIGTAGKVCLYTSAGIDLVVDVNGYVRAGASPVSLVPARVLETRTGVGLSTVDGLFQGGGRRPAGTTMQLTVAGRGGVPADAAAVVLNVTGVNPDGPGYVTVFPCGTPPPNASNLNFVAGDIVANLVLAKIGTSGRVCLFTSAGIDLVVDVNGYVPATGSPASLVPARVLETRTGPGFTTVDGQFQSIGRRPAYSTLQLTVTGRGGVPTNASAVILNVTAVNPNTAGHLTVYPCGTPPPNASNLNFVPGDIVPNAVLAKTGTAGRVCIYTTTETDLVIDVNGHTN